MRCIAALLTLLLFMTAALAEGTPSSLRQATSVEAVEQFLRFPEGEEAPAVEAGYIRYIAQNEKKDPLFFKPYWLGGEEGSELDLTVKKRNGYEYGFHAGTMCTRAAYSMAMSYLGIDVTPGAMSAITGKRHIDEPYDEFSALLGVERVTVSSKVFNTYMQNYLTDSSYSPVYLYIQKPSGQYHALLVVGFIPELSRYLVVDSSPYYVDDVPHRVYFISLNKNRTEIINSTFKWELKGSKVLQLYQWRRLDETSAE